VTFQKLAEKGNQGSWVYLKDAKISPVYFVGLDATDRYAICVSESGTVQKYYVETEVFWTAREAVRSLKK